MWEEKSLNQAHVYDTARTFRLYKEEDIRFLCTVWQEKVFVIHYDRNFKYYFLFNILQGVSFSLLKVIIS